MDGRAASPPRGGDRARALIVSFGAPVRVFDPAALARPPAMRVSFAAGLDAAPALVEHDGDQHGIQVDLPPLAAGMLLGVPARELTGAAVPLDDLLGATAAEWADRLHAAQGWEARFCLLDGLLAERLADAPGAAGGRGDRLGAEIVSELTHEEYGSRDYTARDPRGTCGPSGRTSRRSPSDTRRRPRRRAQRGIDSTIRRSIATVSWNGSHAWRLTRYSYPSSRQRKTRWSPMLPPTG
jgi:hypothetical protein